MNRDTNATSSRTNELLVAAAAIAAATASTQAEAVRFENTTNVDWLFNTLDLTLSAEDQMYGSVSDATGTSIYMDYFGDSYPAFSYSHTYTSGNGAEIFNSGFSDNYAKPLDFGSAIGPSLNDGSFNQGSTFEFSFTACNYPYFDDCTSGNRGLLPAGEDTYLGVRLTIDGNFHYGWVAVNRSGTYLDILAWGYETEAGVAIGAGVPTPGPLAVLAVGAAGVLTRKKRCV